MILPLLKKQVAVWALLMALCCPCFLLGQNAEIDAAEKEMSEARKDTLHPKRYALAIIKAQFAYEDYIRYLPILEDFAHEALVKEDEDKHISSSP
jgi:hypothetical protein